MNVTTVGQDMALTQSTKFVETEDAGAFSQELKKQLTHKKEAKEDGLKEDLSQSILKPGDKEQSEDNDEEEAFVIVPSFFRFESTPDVSKTVLSDIHIDKETLESTVKMEASESLQLSEMTLNEAADLINVTAEYESEQEVKVSAELKSLLEDESTDDLKSTLDKDSSDLAKETTVEPSNSQTQQLKELITPEKEAERQVVPLKEAAIERDADNKLIIKEPLVSKAEPVSQEVSPSSSEEKNALVSSTEPLEFFKEMKESDSFDFTEVKLTEEGVEAVKTLETAETEEIEITDASTRLALSQTNQSVKASDPASLTPLSETAAQVPLEDSPEIIQEMMLTVASKESGDKVYESKLTLTPETLGEIKVEMTYSDEGLKGRLVFETEEAKQWVESQWQQMSRPLELNGIKLDGFDFQVVKAEDLMQTTNFNFSKQSDQSKKEQQEKRKETLQPAGMVEEEKAVNSPVLKSGLGLNYYA